MHQTFYWTSLTHAQHILQNCEWIMNEKSTISPYIVAWTFQISLDPSFYKLKILSPPPPIFLASLFVCLFFFVLSLFCILFCFNVYSSLQLYFTHKVTHFVQQIQRFFGPGWIKTNSAVLLTSHRVLKPNFAADRNLMLHQLWIQIYEIW